MVSPSDGLSFLFWARWSGRFIYPALVKGPFWFKSSPLMISEYCDSLSYHALYLGKHIHRPSQLLLEKIIKHGFGTCLVKIRIPSTTVREPEQFLER